MVGEASIRKSMETLTADPPEAIDAHSGICPFWHRGSTQTYKTRQQSMPWGAGHATLSIWLDMIRAKVVPGAPDPPSISRLLLYLKTESWKLALGILLSSLTVGSMNAAGPQQGSEEIQ